MRNARGLADDLGALKGDILPEAARAADMAHILDMHPDLGGLPDGEILSGWFDHLVAVLARKAAGGALVCHRALDVPDADAFLDAARAGCPLGVHWTHDEVSASTAYFDGERHGAEVTLLAEVPVGSVDWRTTLLRNFRHPYEQEVTVSGPVRLLEACVGDAVAELGIECPTAGEWREWLPEPGGLRP